LLNNEPLTKAERKLANTKEITRVSNDNHFVTILCVRFGHLYHQGYVERLRNMVSRNITIPYRFVCLTDDQRPIPGVEILYQPNSGYRKGWWHKVHMFDQNLSLSGRILYFDLDVVINNNIDKLILNYNDSDFLGIRDFNRKFYSSWQNLNSSVMSWTHGNEKMLWEEFKKNPTEAQKLQGDQDWIWKHSKNKIVFWPDQWIQSYKWEIRSRNDLVIKNGKRNFRTVNDTISPSNDCCVTVFHGDPKPQDIQDKFVIDNWQ
jgi:hypothetical protein